MQPLAVPAPRSWLAVLASLARLDAQRGSLFPWVPVCLGIGVGGYFALPVEPSFSAWLVLGLCVAVGLAALALGAWRWPWITALVLIAVGGGLAGLRTATVEAPVLGFRYYGAVEGRIVKIDRSGSDAVRLTLDRVVLERTAPGRVPDRVRLSLHASRQWLDPRPGQIVGLTGHLSAPDGPVEPGGFDFRRMAWFDRIGAVGYSRVPAVLIEPAGAALPVNRLRAKIAGAVRDSLPGDTGAFAAAITTGDRSGIAAETLDALRVANLAHLLAISGLHMGLLTSVVFGLLRFVLALPSSAALNWPAKSIAAGGALAAGAFYLALSGGNVATQRAFVMATVILIAIMLDRRAMTLRAVAVAATLVLVWRPEALTGPGFQMSFSATVGLVWVFRLLRNRGLGRGVVRWVLTLVISSFIAGAATAPFGAAHFNQVSQYGLIANLLSVPLMGAIVMPGAVVAAVLAPFGLGWIGLAVMAPAIDWILGVAAFVSGMRGAAIPVVAPGPWVLPLLTLGPLTVVLWRERWRWLGLVPLALAFVLWAGVERPAVLIDAQGALVGVLTPEGRALSKPRGGSFAARVWLENDGDRAAQPQAAQRWALDGMVIPASRVDRAAGPVAARQSGWLAAGLEAITPAPVALLAAAQGVDVLGPHGHSAQDIWPVVHIHGRDHKRRAAQACVPNTVVVTSAAMAPQQWACMMLDRTGLAKTGAVAVRMNGGVPTLRTVAQEAGQRPWSVRQ